MTSWLVRLKTQDGSVLLLTREVSWVAEDPSDEFATRSAQTMNVHFDYYQRYQYRPSDGFPGYLFAKAWAKSHGGSVETHDPPELPEGAVD